MFKRIGIITNAGVREVEGTLRRLVDFLREQEREPVLLEDCADLLRDESLEQASADQLKERCDLGIALGGDGTMLMAAHLLCDSEVPLLGVNLGRIGFLSDISAEAMEKELKSVFAGDYVDEVRFMLSAEIFRQNHSAHKSFALNDIVIQKWNIVRMIELDTYIDGDFVHTNRSDGIIVSTPTGSTAYAMSGGGPILHPTLDALLLVPVCPHTLSNRPIVVHGDSRVEIAIGTEEADHARLHADGELSSGLMPGDRVRIQKMERTIRLIHPAHSNPFRILREKLHWGR